MEIWPTVSLPEEPGICFMNDVIVLVECLSGFIVFTYDNSLNPNADKSKY